MSRITPRMLATCPGPNLVAHGGLVGDYGATLYGRYARWVGRETMGLPYIAGIHVG